jgi:hypothetical protein
MLLPHHFRESLGTIFPRYDLIRHRPPTLEHKRSPATAFSMASE